MIDWDKTFEVYGCRQGDRIPTAQKVVLKCDVCDVEKHATRHYHYRALKRSGMYRCNKCGDKARAISSQASIIEKWKSDDYRSKQVGRRHTEETKSKARDLALKLWATEEFRQKCAAGTDLNVTRNSLDKARLKSAVVCKEKMAARWKDNNYRESMSLQSKELWKDADYRNRITMSLKTIYSDPEIRRSLSEAAYEQWSDKDLRDQLSESIKLKWQDDEYRNKVVKSSTTRFSSSYEAIVKNVLDSYGINYKTQHIIGPWSFDFFLEDSNILIEVNGFYHHSKRQSLDKAKSTYVAKHTNYKLLIITEADLLAEYKLQQLFERCVAVNQVQFNELKFEQCNREDVVGFLSAFHYMGKPNRGGRYYRVTYNDITIAGLIGSPVHRQQVAVSVGSVPEQTIEISRFAIHPAYQIKNLASWTIARFRKQCVSLGYKTIVSFADSARHLGSIYVASGFKCIGTSRRDDYEYVDKDGFRLHKKTVWDAAKRNTLTESSYAAVNGLIKTSVAARVKFAWFAS